MSVKKTKEWEDGTETGDETEKNSKPLQKTVFNENLYLYIKH